MTYPCELNGRGRSIQIIFIYKCFLLIYNLVKRNNILEHIFNYYTQVRKINIRSSYYG